jgi:hypothetical protein
MTALTYETFPELLRQAVLGFDRVYEEHLADYDEVLPHVLLGDLVRFLSQEIERDGPESAALKQVVPLMERAMGSADSRLQELVAVSFLENLEAEDPGFGAVRCLFGPRLEEQYAKYERR